MRLLEPNLTPIAKPAECKAHVPHLLHPGPLRRFDHITVFHIPFRAVALAAGHEKQVLDILEGRFQRLRKVIVCYAERQALGFEAGAVALGAGGRDDGDGWKVVLV